MTKNADIEKLVDMIFAMVRGYVLNLKKVNFIQGKRKIGDDMRRDFTNQFGYFVPTETEAIKNASKDKRTSIIGSGIKKKTLVMKQKGPAQTPPKQTDVNLKKARQLFSALCCIAGMMECTIEEITIKAKGDSDRYKLTGDKRVIERVSGK